MGRKILKAYKTIIYDDGTVENIPLTQAEQKDIEGSAALPDSQRPTGRIRQIMKVMEAALELWKAEPRPTPPGRMREQEFDVVVTTAINRVAADPDLNVSPATVTDKVTRQLNYKRKQDFSYELLAYLEGEGGTLPGQDLRLKQHLDHICIKEKDRLYKDERIRLIEAQLTQAPADRP